MNAEKYTFAVKMVNEIKLQVKNDTWYGTLRHESFTEKFIEQISKSHYFIDAGAEFGFYTWLALKYMPKDGKILAFEPEIERFIALEQALAPFDLVSVYPHALAECEKKLFCTNSQTYTQQQLIKTSRRQKMLRLARALHRTLLPLIHSWQMISTKLIS